MSTPLGERLLKWYQDNARSLPWRNQPDPYAVWVSEVMLQQTRVDTVIPYFERWMERFPTLESLAEASQQEVLSEWEGLGYYSRARNLHKAAQIVNDEFSGELPRDVKDLCRLPGIGRYTAGAISSIAFAQDEPTLDGNIRRVLARVFGLHHPVHSNEAEKRLWEIATLYLPPGEAGEYNQALMDLGATICTPRQPQCTLCPLAEICTAFTLGIQAELPVKETRPKLSHHTITAAIIQRDGLVLIGQRPPHGLLGGMWEFPGGKVEPGEDLVTALKREIHEELGAKIDVGSVYGVFQHAYTHFRVTLHAFRCRLNSGEVRNQYHTTLAWEEPPALINYPMGKIDRQIASSLVEQPGKPLA